MKFGKRFINYLISRRNAEEYFDYKQAKGAIKADIQNNDSKGGYFQEMLSRELLKVSRFYVDKSAEIEDVLERLENGCGGKASELHAEAADLINFVGLNYVAIIKAIKKRNRHFKENFGDDVDTSIHALDLLSGQEFFASPRLARLATRAEILQQQASCCDHSHEPKEATALLEEFTCPICLDTLHNPVVLTCAHRFCWGCLMAHCSTKGRQLAVEPVFNKLASDDPADRAFNTLIEDIAREEEEHEHCAFYSCPVCRKPQVLDLETLHVDSRLDTYLEELRAESRQDVQCFEQNDEQEVDAAYAQQIHVVTKPKDMMSIIPPPASRFKGKMTVLLDLDGTLVSSFPPHAVPRLRSNTKAHLVGVGSKLNPMGIVAVERPQLGLFLSKLSEFAEIIIYTAGVEDYARPIIRAIDPRGTIFSAVIYRPGTLSTPYYSSVKDMARLNRPLERTVLVDDTPLAFLYQPDNGIPVVAFKRDQGDRLLMEAVLPMLQSLSELPDVRPYIRDYFGMLNWFEEQGLPIKDITRSSQIQLESIKKARTAARKPSRVMFSQGQEPSCKSDQPRDRQQSLAPLSAPPNKSAHTMKPGKPFLFVSDFDRTLVDFDVGEALTEHFAPDLRPWLQLGPTATYIPATNRVLEELHVRGVSMRDMKGVLRSFGARNLPAPTARLLSLVQHCAPRMDMKILSDCNTLFIESVLAGAGAPVCYDEIITNGTNHLGAEAAESGGKLVVTPFRPLTDPAHGCPRCPSNLCKGAVIRTIKAGAAYGSVVYAGDGANDICAALNLGASDIVLARSGFALGNYMEQVLSGRRADTQPAASVRFWSKHEELHALIYKLLGQPAIPLHLAREP